MVPRCVDNRSAVRCSLRLQYLDTPWYTGPTLHLSSPTLLPELALLAAVTVSDQRYWPVTFTREGGGWEVLRKMLEKGGGLAVKGREGGGGVGHFQWGVGRDVREKLLESLDNKTYLQLFLAGCSPDIVQRLESLLVSCRDGERLELVPVWTTLLAAATGLNMPRTSGLAQQIHFITAGARRQTAAAAHPAVAAVGRLKDEWQGFCINCMCACLLGT